MVCNEYRNMVWNTLRIKHKSRKISILYSVYIGCFHKKKGIYNMNDKFIYNIYIKYISNFWKYMYNNNIQIFKLGMMCKLCS